jgi:hypothetical protein
MLQLPHRTRFALKPRGEVMTRHKVGVHHLDGNGAFNAELHCCKDIGCRAATQSATKRVLARLRDRFHETQLSVGITVLTKHCLVTLRRNEPAVGAQSRCSGSVLGAGPSAPLIVTADRLARR